MADYRSPAATHSTYAKDDPTAPISTANTTNLAYAGHPANAVTVSDPNTASTTTTSSTTTDPNAHHHHHGTHHHNQPQGGTHSNTHTTPTTSTTSGEGVQGRTGALETADNSRIVKTGDYVTGLEPNIAAKGPTPIPVIGNSHQNRIVGAPVAAGPANAGAGLIPTAGANGVPVGAAQAGPLGGGIVLGGQCECLRNAGVCEHPAGQCKCRGCSTGATVVNPGQNVGVADTQNHTTRQAELNNAGNNNNSKTTSH